MGRLTRRPNLGDSNLHVLLADLATITPGPGKYREARATSGEGKYVLSQHKGGSKAKFDSERRLSMFDKVFKKEL